MTSIASVFDGSFSLGQSLADLSAVSARPTFELQFSILQNSMLDRLSKKIDAFNSDTTVNNVDAFLTLEKKRLERIVPNVTKFEQEIIQNYVTAGGMVDDLDTLASLASGSDATAFDQQLAQINSDLQKVKSANGLAIGMNVRDGLTTLRDQGLGVSDFASYADADSRTAAINAAQSKLLTSLSVLAINVDNAGKFKDSVESKIAAVTLQIEAAQTADKASQLEEINKLKDDTASLLNALSLAFEANAAQSAALNAALFSSSSTATGTIADLVNPSASQGTVLDLLA